jgi:hypothetical protein
MLDAIADCSILCEGLCQCWLVWLTSASSVKDCAYAGCFS